MNTVKTHSPKGRVTQSYKLYRLLNRKSRSATREQIASTLNLKPAYVGSYLSEFKRVYGARVKYDNIKERYFLKNQVTVPKTGLAGRKPLPKTRVGRKSVESPQQVSTA